MKIRGTCWPSALRHEENLCNTSRDVSACVGTGPDHTAPRIALHVREVFRIWLRGRPVGALLDCFFPNEQIVEPPPFPGKTKASPMPHARPGRRRHQFHARDGPLHPDFGHRRCRRASCRCRGRPRTHEQSPTNPLHHDTSAARFSHAAKSPPAFRSANVRSSVLQSLRRIQVSFSLTAGWAFEPAVPPLGASSTVESLQLLRV